MCQSCQTPVIITSWVRVVLYFVIYFTPRHMPALCAPLVLNEFQEFTVNLSGVVTEGHTRTLLLSVLYPLDPQMLLLRLRPGARRQLTNRNITMRDSAPWLRAHVPHRPRAADLTYLWGLIRSVGLSRLIKIFRNELAQ